jgi:hypothetical protein
MGIILDRDCIRSGLYGRRIGLGSYRIRIVWVSHRIEIIQRRRASYGIKKQVFGIKYILF